MESEKVIEAILKLPDGADLYGGDMDNPPIVPLKFGTTDLKALANELSSLRAEVEGYKLMLGDDIRRVRACDWELHPADDGWWV